MQLADRFACAAADYALAKRGLRGDVESAAMEEHFSQGELSKTVQSIVAAAERGREFKSYVHGRLDAAGVTKHPNGHHSEEGCRVGDRLDELIGQRDAMLAELERIVAVCDRLWFGNERSGAPNWIEINKVKAAIAKAKGGAS